MEDCGEEDAASSLNPYAVTENRSPVFFHIACYSPAHVL